MLAAQTKNSSVHAGARISYLGRAWIFRIAALLRMPSRLGALVVGLAREYCLINHKIVAGATWIWAIHGRVVNLARGETLKGKWLVISPGLPSISIISSADLSRKPPETRGTRRFCVVFLLKRTMNTTPTQLFSDPGKKEGTLFGLGPF